MKRNISTTSNKGFSLIELCIVLAVLTILASSITPVFIKRVQIKAGEKTAMEMSAIQQAALAYFTTNSAWPVNIAALQGAGYLNPSWIPNNPWQNAYSISSGPNSFTVSTVVPQEWVNLVARDLPTSTVSVNTVSSSVPAPGIIPNESLPVGAIIIWSGTVASIPSGWQLCDGTNGAPDLRDRFVVGAAQDSGGIAKTNVSGTLTQSGGEASHRLTIDEMPSHTHRVYLDGPYNEGSWHYDPNSVHRGSPNGPSWTTNPVESVGGSSAHNTLPPYYALCFIIKI